MAFHNLFSSQTLYSSSCLDIYNYTTLVFASCDRIHSLVVISIALDKPQMVSKSSQNFISQNFTLPNLIQCFFVVTSSRLASSANKCVFLKGDLRNPGLRTRSLGREQFPQAVLICLRLCKRRSTFFESRHPLDG